MCNLNTGPSDPEARQMFVDAERGNPTYVCTECGHYYQQGIIQPVGGSPHCPKCRSWKKRLAYPWAFEWDAALLAFVVPHEPCGNDGRICSIEDCTKCQHSGHDTAIYLGPPQWDDESVPF